MRSNTNVRPLVTHERGRAVRQTPEIELERAVATCLLFEPTFYEKGEAIAERIAELSKQVSVPFLSALAVKARTDYKLRHVPLWLCVQLIARGRELKPNPGLGGVTPGIVAATIETVIQRPDELAELLSLYWRDGKRPLSAQLKKGLARAFRKFGAYSLAKWDKDGREVKLRDVLFLSHAKPVDGRGRRKQGDPKPEGPLVKGTEALFYALANGELPTPDTWETALSSGADKKESWERLLIEKKLGYTALLMNLRNMAQAGVSGSLVAEALILGAKDSKELPFRFLTAVKHAPQYASALDIAMQSAMEGATPLDGETLVLIDVSGSMNDQLSGKSEATRLEAASALAVLLREVCASCRIFTFSEALVEVPAFRGLGLVGGIVTSQPQRGTYMRGALQALYGVAPNASRLIVITDEQSMDGTYDNWTSSGVLVNVAPYKPGVATSGNWTRLNGWSERVVDFIRVEEELR